MKYDSALMVQLAQLVEALPQNDFLSVGQINLPDYSRDVICGHLLLFIEEDMAVGSAQWADNQLHDLIVSRLTLKGHQFLVVARDQTRWKNFIRLAQAGVGFVTKEGFKTALTETVKNLLA